MSFSRRSFLRTAGLGAGAAAFLSGLHRLGLSTADAAACAPPEGYKALVCVFLYGGNDGNNLIVPNGTGTGKFSFSKYSAVRNSTTCDFWLEQPGGDPARAGLSITSSNATPRPFLLHPKLKKMRDRFEIDRKLAVLFNTGTLVEPTAKDTLGNLIHPVTGLPARLPVNLMAHDEQQREWQIGRADPDISASTGWGGALSDVMPFEGFPMVLSDAGVSTFARGVNLDHGPMIIPSTGNVSLTNQTLAGAVSAIAGQTVNNRYITANQGIMRNALAYGDRLGAALSGCTPDWGTTWDNPEGRGTGKLAAQLKRVAEVIAAASALPITRQIFFCSLGGFDTHADQWDSQGLLLDELDFALDAFMSATAKLTVANQVTTFTMTDFARTFQPGSVSGTDHAWGNHQLILGGAVKGGKTYGTFPDLALGGVDDYGAEGRWIPTTSADQYAATLASWFEPTVSLPGLFPNIGNFAPQTLGFL